MLNCFGLARLMSWLLMTCIASVSSLEHSLSRSPLLSSRLYQIRNILTRLMSRYLCPLSQCLSVKKCLDYITARYPSVCPSCLCILSKLIKKSTFFSTVHCMTHHPSCFFEPKHYTQCKKNLDRSGGINDQGFKIIRKFRFIFILEIIQDWPMVVMER